MQLSLQAGFDFASYRAHLAGTDESAKDPNVTLGSIGRRLDAAIAEALGPEKMDKLKKVVDSIKQEEALKQASKDPAFKQAVEECKKPCSDASIDEHTCAQMDICCSAYGNSKCIKMPGQPSFAEQQTGVRQLHQPAAF